MKVDNLPVLCQVGGGRGAAGPPQLLGHVAPVPPRGPGLHWPAPRHLRWVSSTSTSSWPHNLTIALSIGASNEPSRKFDNHGEGPRGRSNRGLLRDCEISANTRSSTSNLYPSEAELRGACVRAPGGGAARAVGRGEDQTAPQPQPLPAHGHHHRRHPQQTAPAQTQEGGDF